MAAQELDLASELLSGLVEPNCRIEQKCFMGTYQKRKHVNIDVGEERSGKTERMWLLFDRSDDEQGVVFGELDSEPIVATGMRRGQELAVSYHKLRTRVSSACAYGRRMPFQNGICRFQKDGYV